MALLGSPNLMGGCALLLDERLSDILFHDKMKTQYTTYDSRKWHRNATAYQNISAGKLGYIGSIEDEEMTLLNY